MGPAAEWQGRGGSVPMAVTHLLAQSQGPHPTCRALRGRGLGPASSAMALPLSLSSALSPAMAQPLSLSPTMALALPLLLALLGASPGLGAPGGGCGVPPSAWCQDWVTALRCGALGRCPHLAQGHPDMDVCALCQQLFGFLHQASNHSATEKPWQVCATLELCRGEPGAAPAAPVLEAPGAHLQGSGGAGLSPAMPLPLCWMCRSLVARAEAAVPVGTVAAAVAGLCRALPLPVVGACQCLAQRYAALALEGLLGRLGPRLLCRLLLACRSEDTEDVGTLPPPWVLEAIVVRLAECDPKGVGVPALSLPLGPCALGPTFWCSGPEAAQRCQALQHCQEHVWL
ncbi:pulmonary surfactant-associated protein B isoform X2 [Oenanthe melanoleuca]|uniref:pulmonary surfactant-associated protein B isoform X2 n=1 Tax=Oenanthe melanoleuca TaxID=2939378 RepID=UPI0024C1BCDA|nr:pulmonary surfactant-associated protein B isoform X2 [Oenanthe melanoleuca]